VNVHSSQISKVAFFLNDRSALSCGLEDYCIAQWKIIRQIPPKPEERRYLPRYGGGGGELVRDSLSKSQPSRRTGPLTRNPKDVKREGDGSLSRAQLSQRETMQSLLMRKSLEN